MASGTFLGLTVGMPINVEVPTTALSQTSVVYDGRCCARGSVSCGRHQAAEAKLCPALHLATCRPATAGTRKKHTLDLLFNLADLEPPPPWPARLALRYSNL